MYSDLFKDLVDEKVKSIVTEIPNFIESILDEDEHRRLIIELANKFYIRFDKPYIIKDRHSQLPPAINGGACKGSG